MIFAMEITENVLDCVVGIGITLAAGFNKPHWGRPDSYLAAAGGCGSIRQHETWPSRVW